MFNMMTKKPENKNEGVIYRYITKNWKEANQDTLNKVIGECLDETTLEEMEDGVKDEDNEKK